MIVLTLNAGSSSFKFGLYRVGTASPEPLITGEADKIRLHAEDATGRGFPAQPTDGTPATVIPAITRLLADARAPTVDAIGHRIVHGGPGLRAHCRIDEAVLCALEQVRAMSPLHAPAALAIIALAESAWPDAAQIACFDTVFHATMPDIARTLPLPLEFRDQGIQRYGFHGLSCESIVRQFGDELPSRTVIAHLGSGASVTAVRDGCSIDTSMGLTPSGGIVMSTRTGDIDPGILIYLLREKGYDPAALEQLIDHRAGMLGISGLSGDMRILHAAPDNAAGQLGVAMFCLSVAKQIAGMVAALDGVDAIVFTGGIGEHDAIARAAICRHLEWIGIHIDDGRNRRGEVRIDNQFSRCTVHIFPSREDEQIARHVGYFFGAIPCDHAY